MVHFLQFYVIKTCARSFNHLFPLKTSRFNDNDLLNQLNPIIYFLLDFIEIVNIPIFFYSEILFILVIMN